MSENKNNDATTNKKNESSMNAFYEVVSQLVTFVDEVDKMKEKKK